MEWTIFVSGWKSGQVRTTAGSIYQVLVILISWIFKLKVSHVLTDAEVFVKC